MTRLRFATEEDAPALLELYAPYIATPISFEYKVPTQAEFLERLRHIISFYPYLIAENAVTNRIMGYAYAHPHMERAAYQWNAELSVYLAPEAQGLGLGKRLYSTLMALLEAQGILTVYGLVAIPNAASEALHLGCGFTLVGTWTRTGFKCGAWQDVGIFEKHLCSPLPEPPKPPCSFAALPSELCESILSAHS